MDSNRYLLLTCLLGLILWSAEASRIVEMRLLKSTDDGNKTAAPAAAPTPSSSTPTSAPTSEPVAMPANAAGGGTSFDVTKYGAVGDGKTDNGKAFAAAWAAACKSTEASVFLVPQGNFLLTPIVFSGPCGNKKSPNVEIRGKIIAPSSIQSNNNAWILFQGLSQLSITGAGTGSLDGQGEASWTQNACRHTSSSNCQMLPTSLQLTSITGGSLSDITLINSKAFHVIISQSSDFTVHDVKINAPKMSPNTDGVHIGDSTGITVSNSDIGTGDDCVSIGSGTSNIIVSNVRCGPGHGISVGSLGKYPNEKEVKGLKVTGCTFTETDNGVRIKTWPGSPENTVSDVRFEDLTMTNVKNPIIINQLYCDKKECVTSPSRVKLTGIHFNNIRGTSATKNAVSLTCSQAVPCETVELVDINLKYSMADGAATSVCSNVKGVASGVQVPSSCL